MKRKVRLSRRRTTGGLEDCPMVRVRVFTRYGDLTILPFCIDTGADCSALSIALARRDGIAFPQSEESRGTATGLVGQVQRYRGVLRVRMFGADYAWPCDFLDTAGSGSPSYGVLGRAGFTDDFAFCLSKPYFTLQQRQPLWRWLVTSVLLPWPPEHPVDQAI
jgi:hypothetical protein